jgi:hypothetical protein
MMPNPYLPASLPAFIETGPEGFKPVLDLSETDLESAELYARQLGDLEALQHVQLAREYLADR